MMATGKRRPFPFSPNCSRPIARGPSSTLGLRATCPRPSGIHVKTASQMTTGNAVRYNLNRRGSQSMEVNDKAPDFSTTDENGKQVALKDFRGNTVVLFFFPKADTPG